MALGSTLLYDASMKNILYIVVLFSITITVSSCATVPVPPHFGASDSIIYTEGAEKVILQQQGSLWYMTSPFQGVANQDFVTTLLSTIQSGGAILPGVIHPMGTLFLSFEKQEVLHIPFVYHEGISHLVFQTSTLTHNHQCASSFTYCALDNTLQVNPKTIDHISIHHTKKPQRYQKSTTESQAILSVLQDIEIETIISTQEGPTPKQVEYMPVYPEDLINNYELKLYLHSSRHPEADELLYFLPLGEKVLVYKKGTSHLRTITLHHWQALLQAL